ncbi:hypothetical protein V6N11_070951 [Hibiscus sabdariffa]|uniref:Ubiquitinyl hydrolase 1 n=2 Tax=Hibiscus sabdariffa TaxID=183260 RepID=A0ABR1ZJH5_9ROSI
MSSTSLAKQTVVPMKEPSSNYNPYPPPLARYEDVAACPKLFLSTLEKLHATMGTKFMIPIIGGKELDLHKLFVEVTSRGGIEKIIKERRWKEVTAIFNFPSTATNASFVLRKYYISLLHHYEQMYFFKARGWVPVSSDPSVTQIPPQGAVRPALDVHAAAVQQPRVNVSDSPAGSPVIGVIDGKFESGYLVTVTIGSEKLKGVLYQAFEDSAPEAQHSYGVFASQSANPHATLGTQRRRRRRKSEIKRRDPAHPKPNRSGYNFFFAERHAILKPLHPGQDREISRMIGEKWNQLTESEKSVYQEKALEDKERYRVEMEDYREKLRTGQAISNSVPLEQRLPGQDVEMAEADMKLEDAEGGESPGTPENDSSSDGSEFEDDKTADKDLDIEESQVAGVGGNVNAADISVEQATELSKVDDNAGHNSQVEKFNFKEPIMGKRVKKNRRVPPKEKKVVAPQSPKVTPQEEKTASIDDVEDKVTVVQERRKCPHFDKGIDLDKLLTKLRSADPIRCEDCREGKNDRRGGKGKGKHGKKKGSASVDSKSESKAIWVCLECGHYACAGVGLPNASTSHAVRHLRQTRHRSVVQWDNPQLRWCFSCSVFIPVEKSEENGESKDVLCEVVKLIKERSSSESSTNVVEDVWSGSGSVTCEIKSEGTISNSLDRKCSYVVRGLVNLGNTCFFNSVMQNLLALNRLREYFLNLDVSMGQLTISLKKLFTEIKPEMGFKNVINPKPFFASLCAKAPQFRGYQQHDSHELLRCLLDGLYMEELALRKHTNASKSDAVTESQDLTFVDAVFGGQISSTLRCEECGHSSTVYEPFLDLSLSVPTKKSPSKKAQPVTRAKKTKLPPKKAGRTRGKVNKDADQAPAQGIMTPLSNSESSGPGLIAVPKTESVVASSGDSSLSHAVCPSTKADEIGSASQNAVDVVESQDGQVLESTLKENSSGTADFAWLDYLTEDTPPENDVSVDDFAWMDYLQQETVADECDLISQNNNNSLHDSDDKDLVPNESLSESSKVSVLEGETNQKPDDSSRNLQEEELPLLVQDSVVLLLPYKEDNPGTENVRENEASSSNTALRQEEVEFDGFGDMFNEPEIAEGPIIGPTLPNEVAETGFLAGNISDSDPDEVDDSDSPVSVESCLSHFIKPELLSDDNAWNCENCVKILQRQKSKAKKKQTKAGKDLINGSETQDQYPPSSLDKELQCPIGVRTISNGNISSSGDSSVLNNENQNGINVENGQTSKLNSVVLEDPNPLKSNSSVFSKSFAQEQSGGIRPVEHCNVEYCSGNVNFQHSKSYMTENCQSGESDEEIHSENVKVKRNAIKKVLINKAPPILTIHLKRFCQDARGRLSKLNGHVNFRETIDLRPYVDPRCKDADSCIYSLVGVVEHSGTMRGGHYIAYVRGEKGNGTDTEHVSSQWYYASDQHVRQASIEEVLRCEAYILFYEKK